MKTHAPTYTLPGYTVLDYVLDHHPRGKNRHGRKTCPYCFTEKDTAAFNRNRKRPDGLQVHCRSCQNLQQRKRRLDAKRGVTGPTPTTAPKLKSTIGCKPCKRCGITKGRNEYSRHSHTRDGRQVYCKECMSKSVEASKIHAKARRLRAAGKEVQYQRLTLQVERLRAHLNPVYKYAGPSVRRSIGQYRTKRGSRAYNIPPVILTGGTCTTCGGIHPHLYAYSKAATVYGFPVLRALGLGAFRWVCGRCLERAEGINSDATGKIYEPKSLISRHLEREEEEKAK